MQQEQPQLYSTITQPLSQDEQGIVQQAIHQAETNAQVAQAAAAQAAQNAAEGMAAPNGGA